MKFITQPLLHPVRLMEETDPSNAAGKRLYVQGVFLQSGITNRNHRIYPEEVMDPEVNRYVKEYVSANKAYGELGHPDTPQINLERVSHLITSLKKEGQNYIGKARIMDTPMGHIAEGLLRGGANLGVSSRAMASIQTNEDGVDVIQPDFHLSTAGDLVSDPSAPDAYVEGVMEQKEWIFVEGKYVQRDMDRARQRIRTTRNRDERLKACVEEFKLFLSKIG